MSRKNRSIAVGLMLAVMTMTTFASSITSYAKTVTKNNYENLDTGLNFYGDKTYINGCGVQGSITLSAGTAKKIDGKFYGSDSDTVIIKWKDALSACNVYLAKKLEVWQPSDGEQAAADYNFGGGDNGIFYYAGKTSGAVKVADSTSGSITVTLKQLKDRPWICGSQDTESSTAPKYIQGFNYLGEDLVEIDNEAPTVSESPSGTTGTGTDGNTWYKDSVKVKFTASDSGTGVNKIYVKAPGAADYTGYGTSSKELTFNSGGDNKFYYYADDKIGNASAKANKTYKVDNAAPTATLTNTTGGFATSVVLNASFADSQSGVTGYAVTTSATAPSGGYTGVSTKNGNANVTITGNGTYYLHVKDAVGHTKTSSALNVSNIDKSAPTVSVDVQGQIVNNWYKGGATLKFTAADTGGSGVKSITVNNQEANGASRSLAAPEGSTDYSYFATDNAGNRSGLASRNVRVDKSVPVNVSLAGGTSSWTDKNVTLTMKGQDIRSGLASLILQYSSDNSSWTNYKTESGSSSVSLVTKDVAVDKNGYYRVVATDNVGYTTTGSQIIHIDKIDKIKPDVKLEIDGELKDNGWYKGKTMLKFTATDEGGSGVKSITVNDDEKAGDKREIEALEGIVRYIYFATDNAGGPTDPIKEDTISVDKTRPEKLKMTPDKTEWTSEPIKVSIHAEDKQSGIEMVVFEYSKDKTSWTEYKKYDYTGSNKSGSINETIKVTDNGYYRLVVTDRVGYVTTSSDEEILEITNYDPTAPNADTIGIEPDTIQWVDEETGVEVTSFGSDEESGLNTVEVLEKNEDDKYEPAKIEEYNGEKTVEEAKYDTHINNQFKTAVTDRAGNIRVMKDEEALPVENIDPKAPDVSIEALSDVEEWISADKGFKIKAVSQDEQSGTDKIILQRLKESEDETEEWEDTEIEYKTISVVDKTVDDSSETDDNNELELSRSVKKRVMVASTNKGIKVNKSERKKKTDEIVQCETGVITVEFVVRENGTYRLKGADLVKNTAYTENSITITKLDDVKPVIRVEGNPDKWQNKDAVITVIATDETNDIAEMTLDGKKMNMGVNEAGECYFTFKASKNQRFKVTATDEAGNITEELINVTKIDKEAPVIVTGLDPAWQDGYRNLSIIVTDGLSGIKRADITKDKLTNNLITGYEESALNSYECYYKINENGAYVIYAEDIAGNKTTQELEETDAKILKAIEVVVPPEKTVYYKNQSFKKKGMIVDAIYNDNSRKKNISEYIILNGEDLPLKQDKIDLSYTENQVTVYTDTPIKVKFSIIPKPDKPDEGEEEEEKPKKPDDGNTNDTDNTDNKDNTDKPDNVVKKVPITPVPTPVTPTGPDEPEEEKEVEPEKVPAEKEEVKIPVVEQEPIIDDTGAKKLPIAAILGSSGLILIFLFIILCNVKIYAMDLDGEYKFLGKTRAIKGKDCYAVKTGKMILMRAESSTFKYVFSKGFKKTHGECDVIIQIEKIDYERHLKKEQDTIYIEHRI